MTYFNNRFPSWGAPGESPPDGFEYSGGDLVNEKHLDYLWDSLRKQTNDIQGALNEIDADSDGTVDAADTARLLKGNDIDSNSDGVVDKADDVERRYREANIPSTEMADGDTAVGLRRHLRSVDTMNIWQIGVLNDEGNFPNGLNITVWDEGRDQNVISRNTNIATNDPLTSVDGPTTVAIRIDNNTNSPQNASGFVLYSTD